ncbi:hypothetical protein [Metabacillus idriensis]|uniref:hypothetical protein n=1 Tax=Metabacillus idriensis TaxID=324768 RepID=UPI003D2E35E7
MIEMVDFYKISTLYFPHVTKVFMKRMTSTHAQLSDYDLILPVEKHPDREEYILVGRYDCYEYISTFHKTKEVLCIIEEFTEKETQYFKILRRLHNKGDSNKKNKKLLLNRLEHQNFSKINKMTGFSRSELKDYRKNIKLDCGSQI